MEKEGSWVVVALCAVWYMLSAASNAVGKAALSEFPLPATLAAAQLALTAAWLWPTLALLGAPPLSLRRHARALLPLAALKFLSTAFSQLSISLVPVSYAHTVKATTPLWTATLAWLCFGERASRRVVWSLALIAGGVALASAGELQWRPDGLAAALAAAALLAAQHLATKRAILEPGVHHLRLLQALTTLAVGPALAACALVEGAGALGGAGGARWACWLAADGSLAFLQAVAAFALLRRVSPLTYGVASAAKRAAVVAASLAVFRNHTPPANVCGMLLAAAGVALYTRAKHLDRRAPPVLPL